MPSARRFLSLLVALAAIGGLVVPTAQARTHADEVQTIWRLLDYVAVDYGGAVANGAVTSAVEYAEMTEFSATVRKGIAALPASPARAGLVAEAGKLEAAIASKSNPVMISLIDRALSLSGDVADCCNDSRSRGLQAQEAGATTVRAKEISPSPGSEENERAV